MFHLIKKAADNFVPQWGRPVDFVLIQWISVTLKKGRERKIYIYIKCLIALLSLFSFPLASFKQ